MDVYKLPMTDPSKGSKRGQLSLRRNSDGLLETLEKGAGKPEEVGLVHFLFPSLTTEVRTNVLGWELDRRGGGVISMVATRGSCVMCILCCKWLGLGGVLNAVGVLNIK